MSRIKMPNEECIHLQNTEIMKLVRSLEDPITYILSPSQGRNQKKIKKDTSYFPL